MSTNPFILANLHEGESCKEMIMGDVPLFTQDHYDTIKQLIADNPTLTHIGTRIYFKKITVQHEKLFKEYDGDTIGISDLQPFCDVTVMTKINRDLSLHLATCDIIEKIFEFIKPSLRFH